MVHTRGSCNEESTVPAFNFPLHFVFGCKAKSDEQVTLVAEFLKSSYHNHLKSEVDAIIEKMPNKKKMRRQLPDVEYPCSFPKQVYQ